MTENALPTMEKVVAEIPVAITRIVDGAKLGPLTSQAIIEAFGPLLLKREAAFVEADKVLALDPLLPSTQDAAETSRKAIKKIRLAGEGWRKSFKDDFLRGGKAIDGIGHAVTDPCEEMETKLEAVENFARIQEAKKKAELNTARTAILTPFGYDISFYDLGAMADTQFTQLHQSFISMKADTEKKAREAEETRIAAERARLAEEARIREENAKLQREAEEKEKALAEERARVETARQAAETKARQEREVLEAKAKAEKDAAELVLAQERREAAERARLAAEASRKEREALKAKAAEERASAAKREAVERAAREKAEADLAAAKAAEEKKRKADLAAKKKAEAAPDRIKLMALAKALRDFPMPTVSSADAVAVVEHLSRELAGLAAEIEDTTKE